MESLGRKLFAIVFVALCLAHAAPVAAQSSASEGPTWEMNPGVDLPIVAVELAVGFGWLLGSQLAPPFCAPECDRNDVWGLDRFSAGWYDANWSTAGDLAVLSIFLGAAATLWIDEGFVSGLSDTIVVAEAVAGSVALSILSNMSTRRPRPHVYGTESPLEERQSGRATYSFFSGHTAGTFAAAIATFLTLRKRHPDAVAPWIALAVGLTAASFVGVTRVVSGQHFLSDTVAGAIVGTGLGLLVPNLHGAALRVQPRTSDTQVGVELVGML